MSFSSKLVFWIVFSLLPSSIHCTNRWIFEERGKSLVKSIGNHNHNQAREISGVVASRKHVKKGKGGKKEGVLWAHNDSGSAPYLFALNSSTGEHIAWFEITGDNVPNYDWEDIAIGPGPEFGYDYLYVGDVGSHQSEEKIIRFKEPDLPTHSNAYRSGSAYNKSDNHDPWEKIAIKDFDVIRYRYPSGKTHDCEAITVDPISGDIYIMSKHKSRLDVYVLHSTPPPLLADEGVNELKLHYSSCNDYRRTGTEECEVCNGCKANLADYNTLTAADISPAGYGLIMSDYTHVFYWRREFLNESFFEYEPVQLPYSNRHGTEEALCWAADSKGYYIIPEGHYPELVYYPYADEAWWSSVRDQLGSCYIFFHLSFSQIATVRSIEMDKDRTPDDLSPQLSPCIPVPCSEFPKRKQQIASNVISFFNSEETCTKWHDVLSTLSSKKQKKLIEEEEKDEDSIDNDEIVHLIEEHSALIVSSGKLQRDIGEDFTAQSVDPPILVETIGESSNTADGEGM